MIITYFNDEPGALIQVYEVECAVTKNNNKLLAKADLTDISQIEETFDICISRIPSRFSVHKNT